MKRATRILTDHQDDVVDALDRFGDHEDMSEARIVKWLEQFRDPDIPLATQVVRAIRYLNAANLRAMTKQLFQIAIDELNDRGYEQAVFVPVGDAGSGSSTVARVLRERLKGTRHRMLSMVDLIKVGPGSIGATDFERGFGNCGLLLAFKHGCPNNSLPVLWYSRNNWRPFFNRRAI